MIRASLAVVLALVACKQEPSKLDSVTANRPAPAPKPAPDVTAPKGDAVMGTVLETMNAAGYTYAKLDRDGTEIWVAGPETKLAVGTKLGRMDGSAMPGFRSETLKRTFDQIYFVNSFAIAGGAPAAAPVAAAPAAGDDEISGVVLQTMASGGYTYAQLDHAGKKLWVAGPETKLAVGAKLGKLTGSLMTGFHSDTLNRTFDEIYFISGFGAAGTPEPAVKTAAPAGDNEKVAAAPGGKTVADVFAGKDALTGKPVVVRGKVVKLNNGIMGRNWVHLRDGTGAAGTDDLLITTDDTAKLGDIVVARGTVATHQDFGAGYKYDVIVEKAKLASQ